MVDQTVFESDEPASSEANDNQSNVVAPTEGSAYIGEGKKYATEALAIASIAPAQDHISTLEQELVKAQEANEALVADLRKRETAEEIISRINKPEQSEAIPAPTVDLEEIKRAAIMAAQETLSADKNAAMRLANEKMVSDKLKADHGESVAKVLADRAAEVGMSMADMKAMSQVNPKAVLAMFDKYSSIDMPSKSSNGVSSVLSSQIAPSSNRVKIMGASTTAELNSEWRRCKDLNN